MPEMEKFARKIQRVTTAGDEATLELMSMGASMAKMAGDDLKAATVAAMGLAKAYKMDNVAAMRLVARARMGDTASLSRYGIKLGEGLTAQEKFNKVLEIGASNFSLATGEVDTHNGMIDQMKNSWGDLKESLGEAMTKYLPGVRDNFVFLRTVIENWGLVMKLESTRAKLALVSYWEDAKYIFSGAIPQLLQWFKNNWAQIFLTVYDGTAAIFKNMYKNITEFFKATWSMLKGQGFDFTWTGLLDGFESTLEEMPVILKRQMTKVEKAMADEFDKMSSQFNKKILTNLAGEKLDLTSILKGSGLTDAQVKNVTGKGGKGSAATEARLLTLTPGSRMDPAKQTADNTRNQVRLQQHIVKELQKLNTFMDRQSSGAETIKVARLR